MPHVRIKSISEKQIQKLSESLPKELAKVMETTEDNFTFELIPTQYFSDGKSMSSYPYIEVHWFERSLECKIKSAKIFTDKTKELTNAQDVAVVFVPIKKSDYFENGESF